MTMPVRDTSIASCDDTYFNKGHAARYLKGGPSPSGVSALRAGTRFCENRAPGDGANKASFFPERGHFYRATRGDISNEL